MKHRLAKTAVLWTVMASMMAVMTYFVLLVGINVHIALETPFGYARLWLSPGRDVTRHVDFVLGERESRGRYAYDKVQLLKVLELDVRWGSRLVYDKTVLIKYAGDDMARIMYPAGHMNYEEPMQGLAATIIVGGKDADLVRAAFDHYRADEGSRHTLCSRYAILKALEEYYNPAAVAYCRDTPARYDIRKLLFE